MHFVVPGTIGVLGFAKQNYFGDEYMSALSPPFQRI